MEEQEDDSITRLTDFAKDLERELDISTLDQGGSTTPLLGYGTGKLGGFRSNDDDDDDGMNAETQRLGSAGEVLLAEIKTYSPAPSRFDSLAEKMRDEDGKEGEGEDAVMSLHQIMQLESHSSGVEAFLESLRLAGQEASAEIDAIVAGNNSSSSSSSGSSSSSSSSSSSENSSSSLVSPEAASKESSEKRGKKRSGKRRESGGNSVKTDDFFDSALNDAEEEEEERDDDDEGEEEEEDDEDDDESRQREHHRLSSPVPSTPKTSISSQKSGGSRHGSSEFTMDALRRNWDLEEDLQDGLEQIGRAESTSIQTHAMDAEGKKDDKRDVAEHLADWRRSWASEVRAEAGAAQKREENAQSSPSTSSAAVQSSTVLDERLRGDFSYWHAGPRLSVEGARAAYAGLFDTALSTGDYYSVHVVECAVRPDVDLRALMAVALRAAQAGKLAVTLAQRSHALVLCPQPSSAAWSEDEEWDLLDVQVCVSRELKQRVMLLQFMRKLSPFSSVLASPPLENCPRTRRLVNSIQRLLASSLLSLSCLYVIPLSEVCVSGPKPLPLSEPFELEGEVGNSPTQGKSNKRSRRFWVRALDPHFAAQMHELCRESMWTGLADAGAALDDYLGTVELQCAQFMAALAPVYKQHSLPMPLPPHRKRITDFPLLIPEDVPDVEVEEEDDEDDEEESDSDEEEFNVGSKQIGVGSLNRSGSEKGIHTKKFTSFEVDPSETAESSPVVNKRRQSLAQSLDGMGLCLSVLSRSILSMQRKCDAELTARLQQKNGHTVQTIGELCSFRKRLLSVLADSREARQSSLAKTFTSLFLNVPEMLPLRPGDDDDGEAVAEREQEQDEVDEEEDLSPALKADSTSTGLFGWASWMLGFNAPQVSSSSSRTDSSASAKKPQFVPSEKRHSLTAETVQKRLEAYREGEKGGTFSSIAEPRNLSSSTISTPPPPPPSTVALPLVPKPNEAPILFYCACLVRSLPGTLYLTPSHLCLAYGVPGLHGSRDAIPLRHVNSILAAPRSLKVSIYSNTQEFGITPLLVEAQLLRSVIVETKEHFTSIVVSKIFQANVIEAKEKERADFGLL